MNTSFLTSQEFPSIKDTYFYSKKFYTYMSKFSKHNFKNEKALVRVDFNVPLDNEYNITDDTRMRAAVPTIKKILNDGGSVILMSHFGRPKDGPSDKYSLKHLVNHLQELLGNTKILFANDCIGE